jgi:hypothetical protein
MRIAVVVTALSVAIGCSSSSKNAKAPPPKPPAGAAQRNDPAGDQQNTAAAANAQANAQANATALSEQSIKLAATLAAEMNAAEKKLRVSVLPFTDIDGKVCPLGKYVSDKIVTGLPRSEHYALVERSRLDQVMQEMKIETSSMMSDETVASLGNMLGADALIIGTFTDLGASIDVNCRIIQPETGLIIATANVLLARGPAVDKLWAPAANPGQKPPPNAAQGAPQQGALLAAIPLEQNTNRPGRDYRHFELDEARPRRCLRACAEEPQCRAFTYVKPGVQGPSAQCWLKNAQPRAILQPGTISGIKTEAVEAAAKGKQPGDDPKTFPRPIVDGHPLAMCIAPKQGCGINAATAFCQKRGFDRAVHFTADPDVGDQRNPPKRIGDGGLCKKPGCDGISSIICVH